MNPSRRCWAVSLALVVTATGLVGPLARGEAASPDDPPATPQAACGRGSWPETDLQGRVPPQDRASGRSALGYSCNATRIGGLPDVGRFKVLRHVDRTGGECAYYDNGGGTTGTRVVDMSDPTRPRKVRDLTSPAMTSPHETLLLDEERGRLIAVMGAVLAAPGVVEVWDVATDCTAPRLLGSAPMGLLGHESGLSPDGRTVWSTSLVDGTVAAVDIADPARPVLLWTGRYNSHGLSVSPDGRTAYLAVQPAAFVLAKGAARDLSGPVGLTVLDVSEVQDRRPAPQVRRVSHLSWPTASVPQNSLSMRIGGQPYLLEFDEFRDFASFSVGAARIIDAKDPRALRTVSDLRLEVHQRQHLDELSADPGGTGRTGGYSAHYCAAPSPVDPGIVACSFIYSGLRVFDVRDPARPVEAAYYNVPQPGSATASAYSAPAFAPERREVWYVDSNAGFQVLRLSAAAWPTARSRR